MSEISIFNRAFELNEVNRQLLIVCIFIFTLISCSQTATIMINRVRTRSNHKKYKNNLNAASVD